jgi:uncharacterized coiled-coil protein SlyX
MPIHKLSHKLSHDTGFWSKQAEAPSEVVAMVDASFPAQTKHDIRGTVLAHRRLIIPIIAALVLIGGGWITVGLFGAGKAVAPASQAPTASATRESASDELLETTKALGITQQQAVDQLQVVQDQLVAQKAETRKLSDQVAAVTEKLDVLQQSVAHAPHAPPPVPAVKSR